MPRFVRSSLLIPLTLAALLTGCASTPDQAQEESTPFVFRALDLNQRRDDGSRDWDLSSPEARYNLMDRTVQAQRPAGVVYRSNQPYLRLSADQATLINDGEQIILEGRVQLQQLTDQRLLIEGERLVWSPVESRIVIDRQPRVLDSRSRPSAERFVLMEDRDQLRLDGPTRLEHWPERRTPKTKAETEILGGSGSWNLQTGKLSVAGPVTATRSNNSRLTAASLQGDTSAEVLDLVQPVRLDLGEDGGSVAAGTTRWYYAEQRFQSSAPVEGRRKAMRMRGVGFVLDEQQSTLLVTSDCQLQQPEEQLDAQQCLWNWRTQQIVAKSDAQRLEGRLGDDDRFQFDSPAGRVRSQFRLEPRSIKPNPRKSNPPVSF